MPKLYPIAAAILLIGLPGASAATGDQTLYTFCVHRNCDDGATPMGRPVLDSAGNLYGNTQNGGDYASYAGTVWRLSPKGNGRWSHQELYRFCARLNCRDGAYPHGGLIIDTAGNLYGTTSAGGKFDEGVVYKLSSNGDKRRWKITVLHSFCAEQNCTDGQSASSDLSYAGEASGAPYDGVSPLFGTTSGGGSQRYGTLFQLTLKDGRWKHKVIYNFCSQTNCTDGGYPVHTPVVDQAGNVFGTTSSGHGLVYKVSSADQKIWTETVIYTFCQRPNCTDGNGSGPMTIDSTGALAGVTGGGGTGASCLGSFDGGCGTIFRISLNGERPSETVLYSFCQQTDCADGASPDSIQLDPDGNLLGTTYYGGGNDIDQYGYGGGTVFELTGNTYNVLHAFCSQPDCTDGETPISGFAIGSGGTLFGTTPNGGLNTYGKGVAYAISPQ